MTRPVNLQWRRHTFRRQGVEGQSLVLLRVSYYSFGLQHRAVTSTCRLRGPLSAVVRIGGPVNW